MASLMLSARATQRILRLARTIADLDAADAIGLSHLGEAIGYRDLDRNTRAHHGATPTSLPTVTRPASARVRGSARTG